jgi:hypothetical protein
MLTHAHDLYKDLNAGLKGQYFIGKHSFDFSYYRDRLMFNDIATTFGTF